MTFFSMGSSLLLSPLTGALIDRWNWRLILIGCEIGAGLETIAVLVLSPSGHLALWHVYSLAALLGISQTFQLPASNATITMMISPRHSTRANGMRSFADSVSTVVAPLFAGIVFVWTGMDGILLIDVLTFGIAAFTLVLVQIPQPAPSQAGHAARGNMCQESLYGVRYLTNTFSWAIFTAMILALTPNNTAMAAGLEAVVGIGGGHRWCSGKHRSHCLGRSSKAHAWSAHQHGPQKRPWDRGHRTGMWGAMGRRGVLFGLFRSLFQQCQYGYLASQSSPRRARTRLFGSRAPLSRDRAARLVAGWPGHRSGL
jgi:hypothetical protein